ncbi:MAG: phospholipase A [Rhodoferax sp.]|uniref:phospholipase A n=1 Tax=Rhodoferax sp. TaxID=50421 RepID=UPI002614440A|nr:phospholipase A [Rhodoferax sp.]MDD5334302.1 phospholipase A [Rhodoferax sp.]
MKTLSAVVFIAVAALGRAAGAQPSPAPASATTWQQCASLTGDREARLACFDQWAARQPVGIPEPVPQPLPTPAPVLITMTAPAAHDCKSSRFSELSRFWELEAGSDCGTFGIRGYRPISLSWIGSDSVNTQPSSPSPDHTAAASIGYSPSETRIQLSVRTKMAQGLLTHQQSLKRDSLWFGYSQQSNWQIFSGDLSRPFRTTDHEPEITYIYPTDAQLPGGWRLRYSGISAVHQSNGQPLPLSRSWNRTVLMAGMEQGDRFRIEGKVWQRLNENPADDDNPDISDKIGRAELSGFWNVNADNTLGATLRHSLRADSNGSLRLEWLRRLGISGVPGSQNGLRFHTQLFTGYGDSLVDYNRHRTVLSIGLSLVDW